MRDEEYGEALENQRDTGRVEAFSDGVFAVAITLLVLNIQVPPVVYGTILSGLLKSWPDLLGYATSFLVAGLFWANHHYMFKYIQRTDHFLLLLNIFLLMCVVLIPFATELLTTSIRHGTQDSRIIAMIYCGTLLLTSIMYNLLWYYVSHYHLVDEDISPVVLLRMSRRYLISLPFYVFTVIIAAFSVEACLILNIVVALVYALPATFSRWLRPTRKNSKVKALE